MGKGDGLAGDVEQVVYGKADIFRTAGIEIEVEVVAGTLSATVFGRGHLPFFTIDNHGIGLGIGHGLVVVVVVFRARG